ncbi:helix-turn-helix domain-containing protein [Terracidiphilus gabretensis]|uniref:helix-turn-helix domain-containing protein n=1 Tax=Terracidiphilus gabretensis TaxID=1577687 RepID=UPI00071BB8C7|nr:helix-turn-helix domain-containing protein [Terracidiphilus gabretensis]
MEQLLNTIAEDVARRILAWLDKRAFNPAQVPALLNVDEAAIYLGRSEYSVRHLMSERAFPVVKVGNRVQIHRADLDKWIEQNKY